MLLGKVISFQEPHIRRHAHFLKKHPRLPQPQQLLIAVPVEQQQPASSLFHHTSTIVAGEVIGVFPEGTSYTDI
jgi:hypothetical protein